MIKFIHIFFHGNKNALSSVENIIKTFHIQKNMHFIYKQYFYKDKQEKIDDHFIEFLVPIMDDLDNPTLIEEREKNIDAASYEKI